MTSMSRETMNKSAKLPLPVFKEGYLVEVDGECIGHVLRDMGNGRLMTNNLLMPYVREDSVRLIEPFMLEKKR